MTIFDQLNGLMNQLDELLTPEIMATLTDEQKNLIAKAKNSDIVNGNLDERIKELENIAKNGISNFTGKL
jgi:hypothetical protein